MNVSGWGCESDLGLVLEEGGGEDDRDEDDQDEDDWDEDDILTFGTSETLCWCSDSGLVWRVISDQDGFPYYDPGV